MYEESGPMSAGSKAGNWAYGQVGNDWCLWCVGASISTFWEWRGRSN